MRLFLVSPEKADSYGMRDYHWVFIKCDSFIPTGLQNVYSREQNELKSLNSLNQ